jgi:glycosyltransferase involved in cell wall biosynthesis
MPLFSFLMPVKNVERYIQEALESLRAQTFRDWELIVVDDGSTDFTRELILAAAGLDGRIQLVRNSGTGQTQALNFGYGRTTGQYIKFIDGDDILTPSFSNHLDSLTARDATYHDLEIVDEQLARINVWRLTSKFSAVSFPECLRNMAPIPRGAWTLSRRVAERLFPMPEKLPSPHEDVWIALVIKKISDIGYLPQPLYLYRQHRGQFYSGIYNFNKDAVIRRAQAMLRLIGFLESSGKTLWEDLPECAEILRSVRLYYSLLEKEEVGLWEGLRAPLPWLRKLKILVIKRWPRLASRLSRWKSQLRFSFLR